MWREWILAGRSGGLADSLCLKREDTGEPGGGVFTQLRERNEHSAVMGGGGL